MAKLLVQFGAGNIGRSLIGQLFSRAGWDVVFLDVDDAVITALNRRRRYEVTIKDDLLPGESPIIPVENVSGVHLRDEAEVGDVLARADLVGTSMGGSNLRSAARHLAAALHGRTAPLPIMLCENLNAAAAVMTDHVENALREESPSSGRGAAAAFHCIEAAISKMVPATPKAVRDEDPLAVWSEAYNTLYLDRDAYPGTPPVVPGVAWRGNFQAYVDRKLLLHNFGHAAAAYTGFLSGRRYIYECMEDPSVRAVTAGAMYEVARGLAVRHADVFTFDENRAWADDLLRRFHNRALADPVVRVGRDLRRKLGPDDRCIGALRLL
ncbi:MAG: mannitol-1-phosphate 5-dehydrogenase [Planctomycetes bacterium]|nr:mannitol-1-phosphate 5-dehydrogenase [Planctomycetota bacterium]